LQDFGVAALSGTAFGQYGEGYIRISTANSEENLSKALTLIAACVASSVSV
jgi:aspartate/methionine/tyrosine aminotransferase